MIWKRNGGERMEIKKIPLDQEKIKLGGHTYKIVDVSSRFFGPMFIILKDGSYYANAQTAKSAVHEVMTSIERG